MNWKRWVTASVLAGTVFVLTGTETMAVSAASPGKPAVVPATAAGVALLGRWGWQGDVAITVNAGSRALLRFTGGRLTALFDQAGVTKPPQIYVRIDGGASRLYTVDSNQIDLTPHGLGPGVHELEIAVKDVDEWGNRWNPPFASAVRLAGFRLSHGARVMPADRPSGPRIVFLGDSITQGVRLLGPQLGVHGSDATKAYAWLTGQAFGADFHQVGFGAQGITVPGGGEVPIARETLGLNFAGSPIDSGYVPHAVVVNMGTNDALHTNLEGFEDAYLDYLRSIRERWADARVFALRPFGGHAGSQIRSAVQRLGDRRVEYVDTAGWVAQHWHTDGLHPSYTGHLAATRQLTAVIAKQTGWKVHTPVSGATAELLAAGSAAGFESTISAWEAGPGIDGVAVKDASTLPAYEGHRTLQAAAGDTDKIAWHSVVLDERVSLPARARSLFAYVAVPELEGGFDAFDARIDVTRDGRTYTQQFDNLPAIPGFLPWNRIHVNLPPGGDVSRIVLSVRATSASSAGSMDLHVDAIGWSDREDG